MGARDGRVVGEHPGVEGSRGSIGLLLMWRAGALLEYGGIEGIRLLEIRGTMGSKMGLASNF